MVPASSNSDDEFHYFLECQFFTYISKNAFGQLFTDSQSIADLMYKSKMRNLYYESVSKHSVVYPP